MNRRDILKGAALAAAAPLGGIVAQSEQTDAPASRHRVVVDASALDLESPGRRDYHARLEHPTLWGSYLIPVTVFVGPEARPGRGVVAFGSNHGDEYEGPVAIKHLLGAIRTEDVRGRVVLVPVLNVPAFRAGRRETPDDGANLNRAFPGDAGGTITSRIADFVTRSILPHVHVVLDIHSGGEVARFPQLASFHSVSDAEQRREMEETARGFGTRFTMIYQNQTAGLLTSHAERLGKITVGTELGWGRAVQVEGVSMARQGILTAAARYGQTRGEAPANRHFPRQEQILADTSAPESSLLAAFDGHFEPIAALGQNVRRGDLVGYLHDFERIDEAPLTLIAPLDGYVVCQAWSARVIQGQVITQVGRPVAWIG